MRRDRCRCVSVKLQRGCEGPCVEGGGSRTSACVPVGEVRFKLALSSWRNARFNSSQDALSGETISAPGARYWFRTSSTTIAARVPMYWCIGNGSKPRRRHGYRHRDAVRYFYLLGPHSKEVKQNLGPIGKCQVFTTELNSLILLRNE
jgi:hypothetical protein